MVTRVMDRIFATAETIAHPVLVPAILVPAIAIVVFMTALASSLAAANDVAADTAANAEMAKEKGWPLAWFEPPKTASELGITHFKPMPNITTTSTILETSGTDPNSIYDGTMARESAISNSMSRRTNSASTASQPQTC